MNDQPSPQGNDVPPFDASQAHHATPRIRPTIAGQAVPVKTADGQQAMMLALGDRSQLAERQVVTNPLAQFMLGHMQGELGIDAIVEQAKASAAQQPNVPEQAVAAITPENVRALVAQLDHAGLLEGPTFDAMLTKLRADFDNADTLPPGATASIADALAQQSMPEGEQATPEQLAEKGPALLAQQFDAWIDQTLQPVDDPAFDALPKAIIAPHLDYFRGWPNYAHTYGRCRVVDKPARVVILGTNHFGMGSGVVGCDKGFESPLGTCAYDDDFAGILAAELGEDNTAKLFEHRYDHEREHSIELHIPWIRHVFAGDDGNAPKVFAALVHDPSRANGASYDGNGLDLQPFVDALKAAIAKADGPTLVVASADLSHVGKQFGDQQSLVGDDDESKAARDKVLQHDREMLELVTGAKASELVASIAWQQNPTRWCSVGNMVATMLVTDAQEVRVLNHTATADQQSMAMITSAAAVIE
ncbi:MAG: AmmeMemoRadiSam system protein B [Planctomycetota bacterium]